MYEYLSQISAWLSQPFTSAAYSTNIAVLAALFLGFVGSVAPCQITANLGAISYFGNRHVQQGISVWEILFYLAGKVFVFSGFGLLFWLFGQEISNQSIPFFAAARKLLGPLFMLIGLFFLGWIRLPGNVGFQLSHRLLEMSKRLGGRWGSFLMGVAFSLGFCPTGFAGTGMAIPPVKQAGFAMFGE